MIVTTHHNDREDVEELLVFVLHRSEPSELKPTAMQISRAINQQTGAEVSWVIPVKSIPKTTSGKLQRFPLQQAFTDGEYQDVAISVKPDQTQRDNQTQASGTEAVLRDICKDVLGMDISVTDNLFDIGVSSLKIIEIHEYIEDQFPGRIEVTELFDHPSISLLAKHLDSFNS